MPARRFLFLLSIVPIITLYAANSTAAQQQCIPPTLRGASVYVPVYSHIYHGDRLRAFNLAATISLRNVDSDNAVTVSRVEYYNAKGKLIRNLLNGPFALMPLHSFEYKIRESDIEGGSGGSILVKWSADSRVFPLLAESIMIGTSSAQGISYSSRGQITSFEP